MLSFSKYYSVLMYFSRRMDMKSGSSLAIANLVTVLCRFLSCDGQNEFPNINIQTLTQPDSPTFSNLLSHYENLVVNTKSGRIAGYYMKNVRGEDLGAFEGIPYAEPPIGNRRFQPPVPKKPWSDRTLMAHSPGSLCMQLDYGKLMGSEDCLNLNVYTKSVNPQMRYPVIVFIHGGFWIAGGAQHYGPAYLLTNDVILVTINYRLGPLGFFQLDGLPGNNGLRDMALAIEWVYHNIAAFGGDPSKITIAGNSAGSASSHLLLMSNSPVKDKIKGVISMSGTAYNIWAMNKFETSKLVSQHLANVSGCPSNRDSTEILRCLTKVDANVIVANQLFTFKTGFFLPSNEPDGPAAFLGPESPDEAYASGKVARVPWIATMTSRELNLPVSAIQANVIVSILRAAFSTNLSSLLTLRRRQVDEREIRAKIVKFYTPDDSPTSLTQETISRIATDRYFTVPIRKAIQMHSQIAPTYAAVFNYTSKLGRAGRSGLNPASFGALHGEDLVYFLNSTKNHPPISRYDSHFAVTKLMVNLFANFAAYGEPLYETETKEIFKIWDGVDRPDNLRYLLIDQEVKMMDDPFSQVAHFWEHLSIPDSTPFFKI